MTCNFFGPFHWYYSESLPLHDPGENLELVDWSDALDSSGDIPAHSMELYYLYSVSKQNIFASGKIVLEQ